MLIQSTVEGTWKSSVRLAHRASDQWNLLAWQENQLAPDYRTWLLWSPEATDNTFFLFFGTWRKFWHPNQNLLWLQCWVLIPNWHLGQGKLRIRSRSGPRAGDHMIGQDAGEGHFHWTPRCAKMGEVWPFLPQEKLPIMDANLHYGPCAVPL